MALAIGLGVGILTSLLQADLDFPWLALVNAASPWLTIAFVAGALQVRLRTAVVAGLAASVLEVVGYYVTAELRGFTGSLRYIALWSLCAVIGGPIFGAAGQAWRRASPAGLGGALLVAAWATEAMVVYQLGLGYSSTAVLFLTIAALLSLTLGAHRRQYRAMGRWLLPALAAGCAGNLVLGLVAG